MVVVCPGDSVGGAAPSLAGSGPVCVSVLLHLSPVRTGPLASLLYILTHGKMEVSRGDLALHQGFTSNNHCFS